MKKILILVVVMLFVAGIAFANVVGSRHDMRAVGGGTATGNGVVEVCAACHTPHQSTDASKQYPLWNHTMSTTASFGVYTSSTFNGGGTIADIGGQAIGSQSVSMLCMGCHDGTVAVLSMYNPPNSGDVTSYNAVRSVNATGFITGPSGAYIGTDLTDDHPVNFTYDTALATADTELVDPAGNATITGWLVGGTLQCSSCHDVHNGTYTPFLRTSNVASALCTTCHIK